MRVALFGLVLANLAFFAWARWLAPADAGLAASAPLGVPKVVLVQEATGGSAYAVTRVAPRCVSVGPFATAEEAAAAAGLLARNALGSRHRGATASLPDGYWIHVGGFASAADVMVALRRMRRSGIAEAEAMPASPEGRRISAGIYADRERAEDVAARLRTLGLEPVVTERTREEQHYWVDLDLPAAAADLNPEALRSATPGAQLRVADCPAPDAGRAATSAAGDAPASGESAQPVPAAAGAAASQAPIA